MRIQRVVLEYHCDIAVLRLDIIDELAVDLQLAAGDVFKTCDHTQCRGLSAAGRSYEDDEFLVLNLKIEILNSFKAVRIYFADVFQRNACHCVTPFFSLLSLDDEITERADHLVLVALVLDHQLNVLGQIQ